MAKEQVGVLRVYEVVSLGVVEKRKVRFGRQERSTCSSPIHSPGCSAQAHTGPRKLRSHSAPPGMRSRMIGFVLLLDDATCAMPVCGVLPNSRRCLHLSTTPPSPAHPPPSHPSLLRGTVLANGGLVADAGALMVAMVARHYSVPLIVTAGHYKLSVPVRAHTVRVWLRAQRML